MREVVIKCIIYAEPGYANEDKEQVVDGVIDVLTANDCSVGIIEVSERETEE
jgi:hypothetical protein